MIVLCGCCCIVGETVDDEDDGVPSDGRVEGEGVDAGRDGDGDGDRVGIGFVWIGCCCCCGCCCCYLLTVVVGETVVLCMDVDIGDSEGIIWMDGTAFGTVSLALSLSLLSTTLFTGIRGGPLVVSLLFLVLLSVSIVVLL